MDRYFFSSVYHSPSGQTSYSHGLMDLEEVDVVEIGKRIAEALEKDGVRNVDHTKVTLVALNRI